MLNIELENILMLLIKLNIEEDKKIRNKIKEKIRSELFFLEVDEKIKYIFDIIDKELKDEEIQEDMIDKLLIDIYAIYS